MSVFVPLLLLLLSLSLSAAVTPPQPYPYGTSFHIDCGSPTDSTDRFNTTWQADRFFTGGSAAIVSEPLRFSHPQEKTLRFFPLSSGKKNCYVVPNLPAGRYYVRTFTVYDNYDGKSHAPSFDASVEGTVVFSWRSPWPEDLSLSGAYSDLFATVADGEADVCFYSIATDPPVIGALELVQVDPESYGGGDGRGYVLVNYGRLSMASEQWGPGFSNDTDLFGRSWQSEEGFQSEETKRTARKVATRSAIVAGTERGPNYFPMKLFQTAAVAGEGGDGALEYALDVDAKLDYSVWLHFAELDSSVTRAGERVFDVLINGKNVSRVDIFKEVGGFHAYSLNYTVQNLNSTVLTVTLRTVAGAALICGLENYALVPVDAATVPEQVTAMKALKDSLRVPDRMGWNGDPCAPTTWDAWEGVTCLLIKNGTSLVISQIDLGSQGLKGYISDQINLLSNLVSLNLSSNSLGGKLPAGLGQKSLTKLDLSHNQFTGSIPESLTSSPLQLLILNDNLLEGRVPENLYSIGVHGGAIDVSGNKGLCGAPLPECPLFWENGGLSTKGKIAVGVSTALFFCLLFLVVYIFCIRRGRNDYDFGLPQDLMSLYAKRNRYQRQKSLMLLEMESQHAKAMPIPQTPR